MIHGRNRYLLRERRPNPGDVVLGWPRTGAEIPVEVEYCVDEGGTPYWNVVATGDAEKLTYFPSWSNKA